MKLKATYFTLFIFLCPLLIFAQYQIEGRVLDAQRNPIAFTNLVLYQKADSTFVEGSISEENGSFKFQQLKEGNYFLETSFVGYKKQRKDFVLNQDFQLEAFLLQEDSESLEEVSITTRKPKIRRETDRIIFDIENTSLSSGNTWEVLKMAPGVISIQDDLKIRNTSATIYINEKKVDLTADELKQLLESFSAENVKQIEILRNPSAKYDAGDGPIINIVTSKILVPGYKGSVNGSYTQAIFAKYNLGTSHYYKNEKLNVFGNYSFSPAKKYKQDESYINFINNNDEVFERWRTDFDRTTRQETHQANVVVDYQLDEKNSLSLNSHATISPENKDENRGQTNIFSPTFQLDSLFKTESNLKSDLYNAAYDLGYQHQFNANTKLTANFHSTYYEQDKKQALFTTYFNPENELLNENSFATNAGQKINIYAGQLDFETLFGSYQLSTGTKFSNINSSSFINFMAVESDAAPFQNPYLSDKFEYDESVFAAYSIVSKEWEKFSAQVGLRLEHTNREGRSFSLNQIDTRNYTNLFPSVYLTYQASENHSFGLDYGRKIHRPKYESLNPFRYFISENSFYAGNPNLQAAVSDEFNLNYTFKNKYSFDFYYRDNGENVAQLVFQNNEQQFLRNVQANVLESKSYGLDFFHGRSLKSWWYAQAVLSAFHEEETFLAIESNNAKITNEVDAFYASLYNGFTLSKDGTFSGNLTFLYISSFIQGSYQVGDMLNLSLGVRKKIWDNRGEFSLNFADVFNEYASELNSTYRNQDNGYYALPENRYVRVGFKYNFGNAGLSDNERGIDTEERGRL